MGGGGPLDESVLVHFTNRHGGVSTAPFWSNNLALHVKDDATAVMENRLEACKKLGVSVLVSMDQVHGTHVEIIQTPQPHTIAKCDGLLTQRKGVGLMVLTADCTPVLLHDPETQTIGALHVGRKGAFDGIVPHAIKRMQHAFGTVPKTLHVWLGPSIGECCYEIDGEVLAYAKANFAPYLQGKKLNIHALITDQLYDAGVKHICANTECTCCDRNYFSYRRDGITGRQAGVIMLKKEA
jgi:YfiH family protein